MGFYDYLSKDRQFEYDAWKAGLKEARKMRRGTSDDERKNITADIKTIKTGLQSMRQEGRTYRAAKRLNVDTTGKTADEVAKVVGDARASKAANFAKGMDGAKQALQMFKIAGQALDTVTGAVGINNDQIDQAAADKLGFGSANRFNNLVSMIPGAKAVMSIAGTTLQNANESAYANTMGSSFTGSMTDLNTAKSVGGKRMLIGKEQAQAALDTSNAQQSAITRIGMETELAKQSNTGELYQQQNFNKYQGHSPSLLLGRNGGTIPELDSAREFLKILSKKAKEVSKYQLGGKIIDPSKNIIPDGAMHKNLNHLSEANEELDGQVTTKGIPVVSENADGTITQHAEVEVGEVIFNLANTKIIEDYWQQYKETGDDSIAIECGKFLTKELLRNTVDKAGIKKEIE